MSGIYTSLNDEMCCPRCGDTNTHVDAVSVATRPNGEDGPIVNIGVTAVGVVSDAVIPPSKHVGAGRRHRIALIGWCEGCYGDFVWLFTQHKGVTFVESIDLGEHVHEAREAS